MQKQGLMGVVFLMCFLGGAIAACSNLSQTDTAQTDTAQTDTTQKNIAPQTEAQVPSVEIPERIVALTSLSADLIHTLDRSKLVGIPGSSLLRQDARFAELTAVSEGNTEPDLEKIVALKPDLVIGARGFHDKILQRLEELNVPVLFAEVDSWEGLVAFTETLAELTQTDPQPLLDRYATCLEQASEASPSALVLVSLQPMMSPNQDSWAGDFLAQFNIQNLTAELQGESPFDGYVTLSGEKVLKANPDMLLVVDTGENLLEQLKAEAFWSQLQATQSDRVYVFDYFGLVNPGSLASIEAACTKLKTASEAATQAP